MKLRTFFAMSLAALAMVACNDQEIEGPNGSNGGPDSESGEITYAAFALKIGDSSMRAHNGEEISVPGKNEDKINNAAIYVFKNDGTGYKDVMKTITADDLVGNDGSKLPVIPMAIGAGNKHIVVVANYTVDVKATLDTKFNAPGMTFTNFHKVVTEKTMNSNEVTDPRSRVLMMTGTTLDGIFMSGMSEATLHPGITESQANTSGTAAENALHNRISLSLDRAVSKFDLKIGGSSTSDQLDVETKFDVAGAATATGSVSGFKYDIRNIAWNQYIRGQKFVGEFLETPGFDVALPAFKETYSAPAGTFDYLPALTTNTDYSKNKGFMLENTNKVARVQNSTYAALQATYKPHDNLYVKGIKNAPTTNLVSWETETGDMGVGYSLFNYENNVAFTLGAGKTVTVDNFRATAIMQTSKELAGALRDLKIENSFMVVGGVLKAAVPGANVVDVSFDTTKPITDLVNTDKIVKYVNDNSATFPLGRYVFSYLSKNVAGDVDKYTMTSILVTKVGDAAYTYNDNVGIGTATFGFYATTEAGLTCYYRVNIFDKAYGSGHAMFNSVVRNASYHANIAKINSIGFPEEGDIIIKPENPLNIETHVQVLITVNKWIAKVMDTEIGM